MQGSPVFKGSEKKTDIAERQGFLTLRVSHADQLVMRALWPERCPNFKGGGKVHGTYTRSVSLAVQMEHESPWRVSDGHNYIWTCITAS